MMQGPDEVVDALDAATTGGEPPGWFEVAVGTDAATMTLVRHDELGELFGWVAPRECVALGVVAGGGGG
ncbi:MAG: hypothetical protein M3063_15825, partial [Actinomycetota bacterium]|nr:hypothetical protein [Actinomycetota bacterium]